MTFRHPGGRTRDLIHLDRMLIHWTIACNFSDKVIFIPAAKQNLQLNNRLDCWRECCQFLLNTNFHYIRIFVICCETIKFLKRRIHCFIVKIDINIKKSFKTSLNIQDSFLSQCDLDKDFVLLICSKYQTKKNVCLLFPIIENTIKRTMSTNRNLTKGSPKK